MAVRSPRAPAAPPALTILIIEDQAMMSGLIGHACRERFGCDVPAEANSLASGLEQARQHRPDLILLDLDLPDGDGVDLVPELKRVSPESKVIALSAHTDVFTLHRLLQQAVDGFVDKNEQPIEALCAAIGEVRAGRPYFSPVVSRTEALLRSNPMAFTKLLSNQEQRLLRLFGEGLSNEEIASRVGLTPMTVQNHRRNVMGKLAIHSTPQLIRYAIEKGFTRYRPQA